MAEREVAQEMRRHARVLLLCVMHPYCCRVRVPAFDELFRLGLLIPSPQKEVR
jgi:hypothetical protein